jgi:hypothetical protein
VGLNEIMENREDEEVLERIGEKRMLINNTA